MIAAAIIQSAYNDLYKQLRNYIWEYETVVKIANLEVASYMAFPDIDDIRRAYSELKSDVVSSDIWSDDKELQKSMDRFEEKLDGADQIFYGLSVPKEIVDNQGSDEVISTTTEPDEPDGDESIEEDIYEDQEESED